MDFKLKEAFDKLLKKEDFKYEFPDPPAPIWTSGSTSGPIPTPLEFTSAPKRLDIPPYSYGEPIYKTLPKFDYKYDCSSIGSAGLGSFLSNIFPVDISKIDIIGLHMLEDEEKLVIIGFVEDNKEEDMILTLWTSNQAYNFLKGFSIRFSDAINMIINHEVSPDVFKGLYTDEMTIEKRNEYIKMFTMDG